MRNCGHTSCIFVIISFAVQSNAIGNLATSIISPVSSQASIFIMVIPVSFSSSRNTDWIGEAPRYFGNIDPCTLMGQNAGISKICFGMIFP